MPAKSSRPILCNNQKKKRGGYRIAVEPHIVCFACEPCLIDLYNGCKNLTFRSSPPSHGLLRPYANNAAWCHKICPRLWFGDGALLKSLSVTLMGMMRAGVTIGDPMVICSAGPIGLVTLQVCQAAWTCPIVITNNDEAKLNFAEKYISGIRACLVRRDQSPENCAE